MMSLKVESIADFQQQDVIEICKIINTAWPEDESEEELVKKFWTKDTTKPNFTSFVIRDNNRIVSHAGLFTRKMSISNKARIIGCLVAVSTLPEYRNRGMGSALVKRAFKEVSKGQFDVILFQTMVPEFYRNLGAVEVKNKFIDSTNNNSNPWWDDHKMIYPSNTEWPSTCIDLCGPGY